MADLRPLPIPQPAQLVHIFRVTPANRDDNDALSVADYRQIRNDHRVLSDLFGWEALNGVTFNNRRAVD